MFDFSRSGIDSVHMEDGFSLYEGKALDRNDSKEGPVHVSNCISIPTFLSACTMGCNSTNQIIIILFLIFEHNSVTVLLGVSMNSNLTQDTRQTICFTCP